MTKFSVFGTVLGALTLFAAAACSGDDGRSCSHASDEDGNPILACDGQEPLTLLHVEESAVEGCQNFVYEDGEGKEVRELVCDGQDGATGPTGPRGSEGEPGEDGDTGPAGPQGPAGQDGADGNDGTIGPQGEPGPAGDDGTGVTVDGDGNTVVIVSDINTAAAGDDATVTDNEVTTAPVAPTTPITDNDGTDDDAPTDDSDTSNENGTATDDSTDTADLPATYRMLQVPELAERYVQGEDNLSWMDSMVNAAWAARACALGEESCANFSLVSTGGNFYTESFPNEIRGYCHTALGEEEGLHIEADAPMVGILVDGETQTVLPVSYSLDVHWETSDAFPSTFCVAVKGRFAVAPL